MMSLASWRAPRRRIVVPGHKSRCNELSIIVAKVDDQGPSGFVTDLGLLENRFEFARYLQGR